MANGLIYWAAGIWPSEGIFIEALRLDTGKRAWLNDTDGFRYMPQPHGGADAASGVSAQGHMVIDKGRVYLPTGRAVPAALNSSDGKYQYFHLQKYGQLGGSSIAGFGTHFFNSGRLFKAATGESQLQVGGPVARLALFMHDLGTLARQSHWRTHIGSSQGGSDQAAGWRQRSLKTGR